ncbi:hypothetical protein M422DRAFT_222082 [Sphaerobolus stellatus SS14]|nr:hypothetical protein M422DRAFT_222082 [Sphaerobolus stellatus SS14]
MDSTSNTPPLGKYLASSDKKVRDKAIKSLSAFLSNNSKEPLPKSELAKLWKGIFYCYWMSDKPLVQQALASELAELLLTISTTSASLAFLRAFWEATVREWSGIDRYRLDKYYALVRKFTNAAIRVLMRAEWAEDACKEYNDILGGMGGPLCPVDKKVPSSLSYHLADIYLQELNKAVEASPETFPSQCSPVPLYTVLYPFLMLAARTPSNTTFKRLQSSLFEPLFANLAAAQSSSSSTNSTQRNVEFPALVANSRRDISSQSDAQSAPELLKTMYQTIFDVASHQDTRDSNRRKMYAIWKAGMEDVEGTELDGS